MSEQMSKALVNFVSGQDIGYNDKDKARFAKLGTVLLQQVAARLKMPIDTYEVRYNKGGIAVSGEVILHHETLYIQLAQTDLGVLYRSVEGQKDYTGGRNRWMKWEELLDFDRACEKFAKVMIGVEPV